MDGVLCETASSILRIIPHSSLQVYCHFGVHAGAEQPLAVFFTIWNLSADQVFAAGLDHGIDEHDLAAKVFRCVHERIRP